MKSANQEQAVVVAPPQTPARASSMPVINIEALIEKAVDTKSAVEVVKELRAMFLDDQRRAAEAAFNEALSAFQAECPVINKGKTVTDRSNAKLYSYAPIEKIEEVIRPVERAHGFSHTFDQDVNSQPGWVISKCIVTHKDGHQRVTISKFPLGSKTSIMSDTQVYAGALTFANRRTLANAYGLVIAGEDLDGAGDRPKPANPSAMQPSSSNLKDLAGQLWMVLKPVRGTEQNWKAANSWMWREEVLDAAAEQSAPDLTAEQFKTAIAKATAILTTK